MPSTVPSFPSWLWFLNDLEREIAFIDCDGHHAAHPIEQDHRSIIVDQILEDRTLTGEHTVTLNDQLVAEREALRGNFWRGDDAVLVRDLHQRSERSFDEMAVPDEGHDAEDLAQRIPRIVRNQPNVAGEGRKQTLARATAMHAATPNCKDLMFEIPTS